jgi:hypothetical protein
LLIAVLAAVALVTLALWLLPQPAASMPAANGIALAMVLSTERIMPRTGRRPDMRAMPAR